VLRRELRAIVDPEGGGTAARLTFREAPFHSQSQTRAEATLGPDDFELDYATNRLRLGRPLGTREWARLSYELVQGEAIGTGLTFDVTTLNGKTQRIGYSYHSFVADDTIGTWLLRNANVGFKGLNWLSGNAAEKRIEFRENQTPNSRTLVDRRFEVATAQFVAGGSFGLLQASLKDWQWNDEKSAVLDAVVNLKTRYLCELIQENAPGRTSGTREQEAVLLGAASHTYWA
jgi:hypothetical protein